MSWPPQDCLYERNCRLDAYPSAYIGCACWFYSHGGTRRDDDCCHIYSPPSVDGVVTWKPEWPDETLVAEAAAYPPGVEREDLDQ